MDGWVNFNPVSELNIFMAESGKESSVSYNIDSSSVGSYFTIPASQTEGGGSTSFSKSGTETFSKSGQSMRYVSGTAFDHDGDGRASYAAYYGFDSDHRYRPKLYIADTSAENGFRLAGTAYRRRKAEITSTSWASWTIRSMRVTAPLQPVTLTATARKP